jgi:hypothetical protein
MSLTITQNVNKLNLTVTQSGVSLELNPTIALSIPTPGPTGAAGPAGADGGGFEESFTSQSTVAINHDLNTLSPVVECYDNTGLRIVPSSVQVVDANNTTVVFGSVKTGKIKVAGGLAGEVGGALTAYKTADESKTNDATPAIDTDLQVELEASSEYTFQLTILTNGHATPDMKYTFVVPSGAVGGYSLDLDADNASLTLLTSSTFNSQFGNDRIGVLIGRIKTSSAGTFGFSWAQWTLDANALTLQEGSNLIITKLN